MYYFTLHNVTKCYFGCRLNIMSCTLIVMYRYTCFVVWRIVHSATVQIE